MATRKKTAKTAAKKAAAKKVGARKVAVRKGASAQVPAKKAATRKIPAKKAAGRKVAGKRAPESRSDAIGLLATDHREVHRLFEDYQDLVDGDAEGAERQTLAERICTMLTAHATIEEEIFYPAARQALDEDEDLLDEAEVEHASAKDLIAQIRAMGPDDDLYDAKVTVLGEYVDHHVQEEENEMFPKCEQADMDLDALGERLAARKQELLGGRRTGRRCNESPVARASRGGIGRRTLRRVAPCGATDPSMNLESLPLKTPGGDYVAIVEASQGTRNKLTYDARHEAFELTGVLPMGFAFPYDFGFFPSTRGGDGDPLDVLLLADESLPIGALVPCRLVGVIEAEQRDPGRDDVERNDRVIAVATKSHRYRECRRLDDVAPNVLDEIERFFIYYNEQKGGSFAPIGRGDVDRAERLVAEAADRRAADR